jgi:MoaA/NifB/PqqE/SkfB family radical SAM enzyme
MCASMATNGYTLADKAKSKKFIDSGIEFIQISLDGINPPKLTTGLEVSMESGKEQLVQ